MSAERMHGFRASALLRASWAAGFVAAALLLVWVIERPHVGDNHAPVAHVGGAAATAHTLPLRIESTYPVAAWAVSRLGEALAPSASDPSGWSGTVPVASGDELLVVATAAPETPTVHRCLRIALGDGAPQIVWSGGDVTATVVVP